jgi:iron(III) transport system substrate-binding protein
MKGLTLSALACLLASGAQAQDLNRMTAAELLPQAQTETSVVVYSFRSQIARVEEAFEVAYPGINLQGFDISSTEQIARLKAEVQAGTFNADVVFFSDAPVVIPELLEAGIIEAYVPPRRSSPSRAWPSA